MIKTKFRNCLKTETVDKLLRISLNTGFADARDIAEHFVAKKQATFRNYVLNKIEHHKKKALTRGSIFIDNYNTNLFR